MTTVQKILIISLSLVTSAGLAAGAYFFTRSSSNVPESPPRDENRIITKQELTEADGKDSHTCYVAVDGIVYEIEDSPLWQNGEHTTSNKQAYCGADMSEAIKQSPHGKGRLEQLPKVGRLQE